MPTIAPGHRETLTADETQKLKEAWVKLGEICGVVPKSADIEADDDAENDKYGQNKEYVKFLKEQSPESIRATIWSMVKMDHPDALILRFLRARKWDVKKAIIMLISTVRWRLQMKIEAEIVRQGEAVALKNSLTEDDEGFMLQYRSGKSFLRGVDKDGRPVYIIRPRLHNPYKQSSQAMETYILHNIESIRILLRDPTDTACLIFDLGGFSLRNMDQSTLRFIIKIFEANYPESLGVVCVHNAPWLFQALWKMIKGWLDPYVAAKINFTRSTKDLEQFIPRSNILKDYGGDDKWVYKYKEPETGENEPLADTETQSKIQAERDTIVHEYEKKTQDWAYCTNSEEEAKLVKERDELARKLQDNYWRLDPYIRSRTVFDRMNVLRKSGEVDFAP